MPLLRTGNMSDTTSIMDFLTEPETLDGSAQEQLRDMVARYPYFGAARILYLAALKCAGSSDYDSESGKAALFLSNPENIQKSVDAVLSARELARMQSDRTMCALNGFLGEMPDDGILLPDVSETSDYLSAVGLDAPSEVDDADLSECDRSIVSFLSDENAGKIARRLPESEPEQNDGTDDSQPVSENLFTETLADIYIRQHRYEEAIEIIRHLYLNFPNKSCYFADQLRFLETLVRFNKQKEK